jgi:hypothetical protein
VFDHHEVNIELERPPHNLIFLNALLSRIYAFLPRPADMLTTLLLAPIAEFRRVHREAVTAAGAADGSNDRTGGRFSPGQFNDGTT